MDFPGKNTGVGFQFLFEGIFSVQRLNLCLLHCRQILYHLSHKGSLRVYSKLKLLAAFLTRDCIWDLWGIAYAHEAQGKCVLLQTGVKRQKYVLKTILFLIHFLASITLFSWPDIFGFISFFPSYICTHLLDFDLPFHPVLLWFMSKQSTKNSG